jgi:uncharacterized protein YdhG (YjbR/CyaY superfamily)
MQQIADYLAACSSDDQAEYERLKTIVASMTPDFTEEMSYGIPTFKYKSRPLLHFGVFKDHMSLFPGAMSPETQSSLSDFKLSKGTIQYTKDKLIPEEIIRKLITYRIEAINKKV